MGIRFRKKIKILPGLSLNISKKGISSLSVGGRGATVNIGAKNGSTLTTNLPGTGLSHTQRLSSGRGGQSRPGSKPQPYAQANRTSWPVRIFWAVFIAGIVIAIFR